MSCLRSSVRTLFAFVFVTSSISAAYAAVKEDRGGTPGEFAFEALPDARSRLQERAEGFQLRLTDPTFLGAGARLDIQVSLLMPGGDVMTGAPEDVVVAGAIAQACEGLGDGGASAADECTTDTGAECIMRSISTMRGDAGETSLAGGVRVSKGSARVETYGTIDELNSTLGFARSICEDAEIAAFTKGVQQDLFKIGSSLATPNESPKPQIIIDPALVDRLTHEVHRLEAIEGMLADWSIPGEHRAAAAYDVARTVCRRAERALVRLQESGAIVQPSILAYVNRLSDLLWLFGRKLEHDAGVSGSLREVTGKTGNRFSRAW